MSKWEELEKAAMAATPGPWNIIRNIKSPSIIKEIGPLGADSYCDSAWLDCTSEDAAYIAAANPSAILELLAERDALKAENERLLAANLDCIAHYDDIRSELDRIKSLEPVAWLNPVWPAYCGPLSPVTTYETDGWTALYALEKP